MQLPTHELKIEKCFADAIDRGEKTFEVRYNADRGFQRGDLISFTVMDKEMICLDHPVARGYYEITYVLSGFGLKENHVAFGIRRCD